MTTRGALELVTISNYTKLIAKSRGKYPKEYW